MERTKRRVHLWQKAIVHFSLCFVMGFFTGFFPTGKTSLYYHSPELSPPPVPVFRRVSSESSASHEDAEAPMRVELSADQSPAQAGLSEGKDEEFPPRELVIAVTPVSGAGDAVLLRRLADTMSLVAPPLLWIVVEARDETGEVSEVLRKTGVMYRHLVVGDDRNFTDIEAELDHQRNVALRHIERHRLSGIVHFAALSNVYDLDFFDELRKIEAFGTWPMAVVGANRKKVMIEGPVCDSSQVLGWHLRNMKNETETEPQTTKPPIHISSFGFNSSILWDPERWGRTSSLQSTSQSSIKFVKQVVLEDDTQVKGIPGDGCSRILLWHLDFSF